MTAQVLRTISTGSIAEKLKELDEAAGSPDQRLATQSLWRLREAACVLVAFDPATLNPTLAPGDFDERARLMLMADLVAVEGLPKPICWRLSNGVRRAALHRLKRETPQETRTSLQKALDANPKRSMDPPQTLLENAIFGKLPPLRSMNRARISNLIAIVGWLSGIIERLPDMDVLTDAMGRAELIYPREQLAGDSFVGRKDELQRLADHVGVLPVDFSEGTIGGTISGIVSHARRFGSSIRETITGRRRSLFIHGPGGVGKSTLLARFILDHSAQKPSLPFVVVDIDKPSVEPLRPLTFLVEALEQLIQQFGALRGPSQELTAQILDSVDVQESASLESIVDSTPTLIAKFAFMLGPVLQDDPLLFVVDTFEEVQYFGPEVERLVFDFVEQLSHALPNIRPIYVGRAKPNNPNCYFMPLGDLPGESAKLLLMTTLRSLNAPSLKEDDIDAIIAQVGGNPMVLRLAARLIAERDQKGLRKAASRGWLQRIRVEALQARLYGRILGHLHDPNVRKLAFPGLVVRRVNAAIIREVLAELCDLAVPTDADANSLLEAMAKEVGLVNREADGTLVYRADIRRVMLETLHEVLPQEKINLIDEQAVRFWQSRKGAEARAEEIYHRLRLSQDRAVLNAAWDPAAASRLRGALEELPEVSRVWLANKLGAGVDKQDRAVADQADWEEIAFRSARRLLENGRTSEALGILRERSERLDGSPLFALEARALYALERFDEATSILQAGLISVERGGDAPGIVDLRLLSALVLERKDQLHLASKELVKTAGVAEGAGVQLPLLQTHLRLLRVTRKMRVSLSESRTYQEEAMRSLQIVGIQRIRADPVLLTETVAELGLHDPDLIRLALDQIGIDIFSRASKPLIRSILTDLGGHKENESWKIADDNSRDRGKVAVGVAMTALDRQSSDPVVMERIIDIFQEANDRSVIRGYGSPSEPAEIQERWKSELGVGRRRAVARLIVEHFKPDELYLILKLYLSENPDDQISRQWPFLQQVQVILERAGQRGSTPDLLSALCDAAKDRSFQSGLTKIFAGKEDDFPPW